MIPMPGDVIVDSGGERQIVAHAECQTIEHWFGCGCCRGEPRTECNIYIFGEEPVEVITKGGGTVKVLPLDLYHGEWPPPESKVIRDGQLVWPLPGPESSTAA